MTNLLILGLLQGSAAVSIMWTMLSTLALTVLSLRSLPAPFYTPWIETYTERQGEAFVDDTTLWTTSYATTCIVTIIARAAVKAHAWARIIFVCGGWLNLKKCYWYAISWRFKPTGEAIMETISDNPNLKISITQKGQPPKDIERVEITEGRQTLGARLCPVGTDDEEYDHRVNEGKKLRQRMQKAPLNKESTVIGF
jgi:hypothetical protein